jgi:pimeloyl-ACP methyl ester carboxylesterase
MKTTALLIFFLAFMPLAIQAGQPGAFFQLSAAAPAAAVPSVPRPSADKPRAASGLELVRTVPSKYWERIECWQDTARPFGMEHALNKSSHENDEVVAAFGSGLPDASYFLLHYGPKWKTNTGKVVVLAHGTSDNATRAWAAPTSLQGGSDPGLLQALEAKGYRVFAVTFPHKQGNLFYEAQYLADAIELAKKATGAEKVTLIGHSAGGLVVRVYVSNYRLNGAWTPYRGDVDQLITLAAPHLGQDFAFRHPEFNYFFVNDQQEADAPMSWDKMLYYGEWKDTTDFSIYGDNFPMQQQMLYDWTGKYPVALTEPDYYTTLHGGQGFVSHSLGIENAILKGGNFINGLKGYPVPADISVAVIAGTHQEINGIPQTETDGPSDGLVFTESASYTDDMDAPGRKEPIKKIVVDENHLTIAYSPAMMKLLTGLIK